MIRRKRMGTGPLMVLTIGILLVCYSCLMAYWEPNLLEYMFSAGPITPAMSESGTETFQSDLDNQITEFTQTSALLDGVVKSVTLTGNARSVALTNEFKQTVTTPLVALYKNAFDVFPRYLLEGRLFFSEELIEGAFTMLVDEQLALALFQTTNVEGKNVTLADKTYRIVGVLRHTRRVGDLGEFSAYIPLKTAHASGIQLDTITLSAIPTKAGEAGAAFERSAPGLSPKGTVYDANREKIGGTFLARLVFCGTIFALLGGILRRLSGSVKQFREACARRLKRAYPSQMLPFVVSGILWRFVAFAAVLSAAAITFVFLIQPIHTFPEYIPAILVEPEEIIKVFWNIQTENAASVVYASARANRMGFFVKLAQWGSIMALYGLGRIKKPQGDAAK